MLLLLATGVACGFVLLGLPPPSRPRGPALDLAAAAVAPAIAPPLVRVPYTKKNPLVGLAVRKKLGGDTLGMRLLAGTLRWGIETAGHDGALMLMSAPGAYRMLSDWRRTCWGEAEQLAQTLSEASTKLVRHVEYTCDVAGARVEHRAKTPLSTFSKASTRGKRPRDVLGLRLVLPDGEGSERACYDAMSAVRRLWRVSGDGGYKDYIVKPKANGYQSLHETVRLPDGRLMEVQIRTASMHAHAEHGAAAHAKYKRKSDAMHTVLGAMSALALA